MSSSITGNGSGVTSFPFNNANENNHWSALSIIGVVATVLGFIAVVWFIFWIFKKEKRLRRSAASDRNALKPPVGESRQQDL
jgi:amino acid transporter